MPPKHYFQLLFCFLLGCIVQHLIVKKFHREITETSEPKTYPKFKRQIITDFKKEQKERISRVHSVCSKWKETNWYVKNVLPEKYNTMEEWMKARGFTIFRFQSKLSVRE